MRPLPKSKTSFTLSTSAVMSRTLPPDHYSLTQLYNQLVEPGEKGVSHKLLVLKQCLQNPLKVERGQSDPEDVRKLLGWLSVAIRPYGGILVSNDKSKINELLSASRTALECIQQLHAGFPSRRPIDPDILQSIIAYTDAEDPWTTEVTQRTAEQVLSNHLKQLLSHEFIVEHVLLRFIRPLFSYSDTPSVTSQSRKAIGQLVQKPHHLRHPDAPKQPWKVKEVSAMTTLRWAIRNMDENMFYKNWHLCIPPLLTLLDDPSTMVRVRGLKILSDLLQKMPSKVLQQTGLGEVFEDALLPTLLFLPELTPVEESICLLESAYSTLLSLGDVRYPVKEERNSKMGFLDRIMRKGVLQGFIHSGDNARIAELLFGETAILIDCMGVHAVKYLKDIIPILSKTLTDPFAPSRPTLLLAASKTTQTTIVNCWPRMTESMHRIELIKALSLCWISINEEIAVSDVDRTLELESVKQELQLAGSALMRSVTGILDMTEELKSLLQADTSLNCLFITEKTPTKKYD